MILDMLTDQVYASGRTVAAQSSDADALSQVVLQDIRAAADTVVPGDGTPGLIAIGQNVADALLAFGADQMQAALLGLLESIVALGDATSGSAVDVDEADIAAYQENLAAVQSFGWQDPGDPTTPMTPAPPTTATTPSGPGG